MPQFPQIVELKPDEIPKNIGKHKYEIVDISAAWCPPCRMLKQQGFPALFQKFKALDLIVYGIDGDECDGIEWTNQENPLLKYGVTAYPTCIFYYKGNKIDLALDEDSQPGIFVGYANETLLIETFQKILDKIAQTAQKK